MTEYELGYTPNNLKKVITRDGLSQPAFAKKHNIPLATLRKWVLPVSSQNHSDMPLEKWLNLLESIEQDRI